MTTNSLKRSKKCCFYWQWHCLVFYLLGDSIFIDLFHYKDFGCFLVLRKLLFVSFCVVVWVLFSVFSIFCITSLVSATPRNHQDFDSCLQLNKKNGSLRKWRQHIYFACIHTVNVLFKLPKWLKRTIKIKLAFLVPHFTPCDTL